MTSGAVIALILGVITLLGTPLGFFIKHLINRAEIAETLAEVRREAIEDLRRQKDRLEISAQIQDKVFQQLHRTLDLGPNQPPFHRGSE